MTIFILAALLVLFGGQSAQPPAQTSPATLSELERQRNLDDAKASLERVRSLIEESTTKRNADCISAFGSDAFCGCLGKQLPWVVDFPTYITFVISPKEELDAMSDKEKPLAFKTRAARDKCVAEAFARRQ